MKIMYDAIDLANVQAVASQADLLAGYDDGAWPDADALAAAFPGKQVVRITTQPGDAFGDVLDVENGDATPADAPGWVSARRAAGHTWPTVYCSEGAWPAVQAAFASAGVDPPFYWVAAYPGEGPVVPPGAVAHQYQDAGLYDISVVDDSWPPPPAPPPAPLPSPPHPKENPMVTAPIQDAAGSTHVAWVDGYGTLIHNWRGAGSPTWGAEDVGKAAGAPVAPTPGFRSADTFTVFGGQLIITATDANGNAWWFAQGDPGSGWGVNQLPAAS